MSRTAARPGDTARMMGMRVFVEVLMRIHIRRRDDKAQEAQPADAQAVIVAVYAV